MLAYHMLQETHDFNNRCKTSCCRDTLHDRMREYTEQKPAGANVGAKQSASLRLESGKNVGQTRGDGR